MAVVTNNPGYTKPAVSAPNPVVTNNPGYTKPAIITPTTIIVPSAPNPVTAQLTAKAAREVTIKALRIGDPEPYIFGRCVATPMLITADDTTEFLIVDFLWSVGEIDYLEYMIYAGVNEGRGTALGHTEHYTGTAGQVASPIMKGVKGGSYDTLANKAHTVIRMSTSWSMDIKAMIRGLKLYDPRDLSTTYSTNPALALGRILTDCGYTMDSTTWQAAADYCDETISGTSPVTKRWEIGLEIRNRAELKHWVQTFAQYCNCYIYIDGGTVYLIPDEPRASNHTVTTADIQEGSFRVTVPGTNKVPAQVDVRYRSISEQGPYWNETVLATDKIASVGTSTGTGDISRLELPGFQTYSMATRYATQVYNKSQDALEVEFVKFDDGLAQTLGDVGVIENAAFNIGGSPQALFALIDNRQIDRGRWYCRYAKYDASHYTNTVFTDSNTNQTQPLYNPYFPPGGPTPTLTEELYTDQSGTTYARIKIVFTGFTWAYLREYMLNAIGDDDSIALDDTIVDNTNALTYTYYTGPVVYGVTYTVSNYLVSIVDGISNTPGTATITSSLGNVVSLDSGDLTNMHRYVLDGDAAYATTSKKTAGLGETWASRFGNTSPEATFGDSISELEYAPDMMQFDGSTGYYVLANSFSTSGNLVTGVMKFNRASFTGDKAENVLRFDGPTNKFRIAVLFFSSDFTAAAAKADHIQVSTQNSAGTNICLLLADGYLDGEDHVLFYAFDGDNGTAVFRIDGVNADDTGHANRVAPTPGTLETGAAGDASVGGTSSGGSLFGGHVGFVGYRDAYLTNWSDFMDGSNPKELDTTTWAEWGAQPLFFHESGTMTANLGSAGAMTKNGTITLVPYGTRWLHNQICSSTFQSEIWDSGSLQSGRWQFFDADTQVLQGTKANYVRLADPGTSPLSFADNAGNYYSDEAQYMIAKSVIVDSSPQLAGDALHVKLPIRAMFLYGW